MGSIILHPSRPIPDVEDWETLLLQAMRRGSYLTLALPCLVPTVGRNLGRGVCVCVRYVCVCLCAT